MASKTSRFRIFSKSSSAANEAHSPSQEAERFLEKGRHQEAVKQAKLAYKAEATPEHHRLLERAYFMRARQLARQGMRASAVEVAQHLLDFGVTASDEPAELARLLIGLGLSARARGVHERLAGPEGVDQFRGWADDDLVAHPEHAANSAASPQTASDAALVRAALERLQAGDDAGALETLRGLARSSSLSEWKFFVRGLSALYRDDAAESQANWGRLDPNRAAARIAERMQAQHAANQAGANANADANTSANAPTPALEALERQTFGEPILGRLRQMREHLAAQEWSEVFRLLGPLRHSLAQVDQKLAERLTASLISPLIKSVQDMTLNEAERLLKQFTRSAQPLPIDPRWNRLWAIAWDGPQSDATGAAERWTAYAADLKSIGVLGPKERKLAEALVWKRVAELWGEHAGSFDEEALGPLGRAFPFLAARRAGGALDRELALAQKQARAALENGLALVPAHLPSLQLLVELHDDWDDDKGALEATRRLLDAFPDNVEALERLAQYHIKRNELDAALPLAEKARRIKPLDESARKREYFIRVGLARHRALEGRFDEGRAQFDEAKRLAPETANEHGLLAREAMLEYKAGETQKGEALVQKARAGLLEPAPLWLVLTIEAARFQMPKTVVDEYQKKWDAARKKTCRSETAGEISDIMVGFLQAGVDYPDRQRHVEEVVAYLKRTTRTKFRQVDVERAVDLLDMLPNEHKLLEQTVKRGLKQHPGSALLHVKAGQLAMVKCEALGDLSKTRGHFETALRLAQKSNDPKTQSLVPRIQQSLGILTELQKKLFAFPFGGMGPLPPFFMGDFDDDDFDDDGSDDDFDDDGDGDDDGFFSPAPKRSESPKPKPKAKARGKKTGKSGPKRKKK